MPESIIELNQVHKVYNGASSQAALESISLAIQTGEFTAIMGPSGSGKSTLLNIIAGLDRPSGGQVRVGGVELTGLGEGELARFRRGHVGFIFQFFHLLNTLTVLDNLLVAADLAGMGRRQARRRADELLHQVGITGKADDYPAALSGGQRQRVAIARALMNRPSLLLSDEPTGALDSRTGEAVMELLSELNDAGQTILLVTHDAPLAARYARRIITLRDGAIVDDTTLSTPQLDRSVIIGSIVGEVRR